METTKERTGGLTVFHLKIIAYVTMFIDHVGAFVILPYEEANLETMGYKMMRFWDISYDICRSLGRIAFPLFCFMLVEGFFHTHNKWRYLSRLLIFSLISEFPFDLVHKDTTIWAQQSVMVTLSIGLLVLILMDKIRSTSLPESLRSLLMFVPVACGALLAHYGKVDYGFKGILVIAALYLFYPLFHTERIAFVLGGGILFFWQWMTKASRVFASLSYIPLLFYNGQKGRSAKWFFYLFYPVHLLLLYGVISYLLR